MNNKNDIFAQAVDGLKRNHKIKTQKQLAQLMGVNENTITRILRGYTEVTEDIITKLQTASGCIFNLQWLRGKDSTMLAKDLSNVQEEKTQEKNIIDLYASLVANVEKELTEVRIMRIELQQARSDMEAATRLLMQACSEIKASTHLFLQVKSDIQASASHFNQSVQSHQPHYTHQPQKYPSSPHPGIDLAAENSFEEIR
jgi:plasmid maintenance system antidote protein VapI